MTWKLRIPAAEFKYALFLPFRPFKGFWDIKREKKGSLPTAAVFLLFFLTVQVCKSLYTGYLFSTASLENYDLIRDVFQWLFLYFGWCLSNWCLTSLFDGEGTLPDVFKATAYALLPYTVISVILIPLSHFFVLDELSFYAALQSLGLMWTLALIFIGMLVTHQYGLFKSVVIAVCTIAGMCIAAYIGLLFFDLLRQLTGFIVTLMQEISLR